MVKHCGSITIKENAMKTKINYLNKLWFVGHKKFKILTQIHNGTTKKKCVVTEEPNIRLIKSYMIRFK